jgi:hypothetical protein
MRVCPEKRGRIVALRYITNTQKQEKWTNSKTGDTALLITGKTKVTEQVCLVYPRNVKYIIYNFRVILALSASALPGN